MKNLNIILYAEQTTFYMKPGYPHLRKKIEQDTARIAIRVILLYEHQDPNQEQSINIHYSN
jgi:hypothetical protein